MAYSLGDPYRSLRLILRINSVLLGFVLGLALLLLPSGALDALGLLEGGSAFPLRLAGAALLACGLFMVMGAQARDIDLPVIVPAIALHALLATVLLVAYLGQQMAGFGLGGQIALLAVFLLCLAGALVPLRYLRAEFRF